MKFVDYLYGNSLTAPTSEMLLERLPNGLWTKMYVAVPIVVYCRDFMFEVPTLSVNKRR